MSREEDALLYKDLRRYLDGYQVVRFHFRLQKSVNRFYREYRDRRRRGSNFSRMCTAALERFQDAVREGCINTHRVSRFRERDDAEDKVECIARVPLEVKDFLEKLAFALRLSQAEVLRMAMEWWMETKLESGKREVCVPARRKWRHRVPAPHMDSLCFSFYRFGRDLIWRFHPPVSDKDRFFWKTG